MKWLLIAIAILAGIVAVIVVTGALLPKAHVASRSARLKHSPETVWSVITGPPDWRPDVKAFEILPARDGHRRWKEIDRHGQAITFEEAEADPPKHLVGRIADTTLAFGGSWTYDIAPVSDGCELTITENGEVYNPIFRFVSRFIMGHTATIDAYLEALRKKLGEA